jgi:hypothetical protein
MISMLFQAITVRTRFKFDALIRNKEVGLFLNGKWSGRSNSRVNFLLHSLDSNIRTPVGLFMNNKARVDRVLSFSHRLRGMVENKKEDKGNEVSSETTFPQFQIEARTMHRSAGVTTFYWIMAAKKHVDIVVEAMKNFSR